MKSWKKKIGKQIMGHIGAWKNSEKIEHYDLERWWMNKKGWILNDIDFILDDVIQDELKRELFSIIRLISMDPHIDKDDENTKRIMHILRRMFLELKDHEIDYEEISEEDLEEPSE